MTNNTVATTKTVLSVSVIKNRLGNLTDDAIQEVLAAICYHAHVHGNIQPITANIETFKKIKDGQKMLAFIGKNAPIKYSVKEKAFSYDKDNANREFQVTDLPEYNAKPVKSETATPLAKISDESRDKKVNDITKRIAETNDVVTLQQQLKLSQETTKAIQAKLKALNDASKLVIAA